MNFPNRFRKVKLKNLITLIIDHRGKTPKKLGGDWAKTGYRAISAKSIKNGQLVNEEQMNLLPENLYRKWMKEEIQKGDVLLTSEAPLGEHLFWDSDEKLVLSQRVYGIRTDPQLLNPKYFHYYIDTPYYQNELHSRASGSTVQGIRQTELLKTDLIVPDISEQKSIAAILSSLDDKIELLQEQNKTLESIAQTIFKEWFVNFNFPNEEGKPYKNSGGEMVDSELGMIPKGWRVEGLSSIADFLNGLAMQKYPPSNNPTDLPVIKIREINQGITDTTSMANKEVPPEYVIKAGDILFSWSGTLQIAIWNDAKGALNQHIFKVSSELYPKWFYYYWTKNHIDDFIAIAATKATTMGHINRKHLDQALVAIPTNEILSQGNKLLESTFQKLIQNNHQQNTTQKLRDLLLPKLINGELLVNG
jgi:type I restriction enzyme S subunit